jgi:hypothetical protein
MRRTAIGLLAAMAVTLCGCFDYEEDLVLNVDGSGTIRMRISMEEQQAIIATMVMAAAAHNKGEGSGEAAGVAMFAKSQIEESLRTRGSKAKLIAHTLIVDEAYYVWDMTFSFSHVNDLAQVAVSLVPGSLLPTEDSSWTKRELPPVLTFAAQDSVSWLFTRPLGMEQGLGAWPDNYDGDYDNYSADSGLTASPPESELEDSSESAEILGDTTDDSVRLLEESTSEVMAEMAQYKIRLAVTFPGRVEESNADSVSAGRAVWAFTFSEFAAGVPDLRAVIKK